MSWTCEVVDETPVESFVGLETKRHGSWFAVDGKDFGTPCSDEAYLSVDIELLQTAQRFDRLCVKCSNGVESKILAQIDLLDEEIARMCNEFEEMTTVGQYCMDQVQVWWRDVRVFFLHAKSISTSFVFQIDANSMKIKERIFTVVTRIEDIENGISCPIESVLDHF